MQNSPQPHHGDLLRGLRRRNITQQKQPRQHKQQQQLLSSERVVGTDLNVVGYSFRRAIRQGPPSIYDFKFPTSESVVRTFFPWMSRKRTDFLCFRSVLCPTYTRRKKNRVVATVQSIHEVCQLMSRVAVKQKKRKRSHRSKVKTEDLL